LKKTLGHHVLLEFHGCDRSIISDSKTVEKIFLKAANEAKANIVKSVFHYFNPYGVSGVVVISESHLSIHTWPEFGYAAIDLFTCSEDLDIDRAIEILREELKPTDVTVLELKRGTFI